MGTKYSEYLADCFIRGENSTKSGNSCVKIEEDCTKLYLHGNLIAFTDKLGRTSFCLCGWNSPTTKRRLKSLGIIVKDENFIPYLILDGKKIKIMDSYFYYLDGTKVG